jgi:hypothetical protein
MITGAHIVEILLGIVAFFSMRTLNKVDKNQNLLFSELNLLKEKFNKLLGAHEVNHGVPQRRHGDLGD